MGKVYPVCNTISKKAVSAKILKRFSGVLERQTALLPVRSAMLAATSMVFLGSAFSTSAQVAGNQYWTGDPLWNNIDTTWKDTSQQIDVWGGGSATFADIPGVPNKTVSLTENISVQNLYFRNGGFQLSGPHTINFPKNYSVIEVDDGTATIATRVEANGVIKKKGQGTLVLEGASIGGQISLWELESGTLHLADSSALFSSNSFVFNGGHLKIGNDRVRGSSIATHFSFWPGITNIDIQSNIDYGVTVNSAAGKLIKDGLGSLNFLSLRPVTGQFNGADINNGILRTPMDYFSPTSIINVAGILEVNNFADQNYSGTINRQYNVNTNDYGRVVKSNSGELAFTGSSNADWTIRDGTLSAEVSSIQGRITNDSNLKIKGTGALSYDHSYITGIGDVTFSSSGNIQLQGTYLYSGNTNVSSGAVTLNNLTIPGSASWTMARGTQMLVNNATVHNLTLETAATLANINANGSFTVSGDLEAKPWSTLSFAAGSPSNTTRMTVLGNLTIDNAVLDVYQGHIPTSGKLGVGYYRLIAYSGTLNGTFGFVDLPQINGAVSSLQYGAGSIDLLIEASGDNSLQYWNGGNGVWDSTTAFWTNDRGAVADIWGGKIAIFKDTPTTIGGVIDINGNQSFSGIQFVNDGYILNGSGSLSLEPGGSEIRVLADSATINTEINGSGSLLKTEAGTLILNGNNSYTGGTTIYAGDVQISSDTNLGLGAVSLTGGALTIAGDFTTYRNFDVNQRGTMNVMDGKTLNANGVLSGNGTFLKDGNGTLVLNGVNTITGNIGIKAGELVVNNDSSLGHVSNDVSFMGGTLTTTASFATSRNFNLDVTGNFNVDGSTALTLNGNINGANDLTKSGAGILTLNGTNSFRNLNITNGFVVGNATSFGGDIRNAGTAIFNVTGTETYNGNIQGLNTVHGSMVKDGSRSLTLAGVSLLDWSINKGELVIDANKFGGNIDIGALGTAVVSQPTNGTLAGVLSGTGTILKNGEGTLFLTGDSSAFGGVVKISSGAINTGTADAKGALGGSLIVESGGILSGVGTIGSGLNSHISIADGGILAPGNSIGTLTVNGNLVLESGSIYNVETDPLSTESDRITVTGDATINGGTVAHIGFAGDYALNTRYTILQADGKLTGSFGNVTSEFAFLNPSLFYDYNAGLVQLELARNEVPFISKGTTANHFAVANALDSMGTSSGIYNAFVKLPDNTTVIANALDSLSGEIYGSTSSALIEESRYIRDIINNRMRGALGGIVMNDDMFSTKIDHEWSAWAQAYGGWNKIDGNGNYADVKHSTGGFLVGADTIAENGWLAGAFAGYSNSTIKADARASSASVDSFHVGAHVAKEWNGNIALRLGVANSWHKVDTERTAAFFGFGPQSPTSNANARTFQAFGEVAYKIHAKKITLEPYGNLAYVNHHTGAYNEDGGAAALRGSKTRTSAAFGTLGIRAKTEVELGGNTTAAVSTGAGYRKTSNNVRGAAEHGFTGSDEFTIYGTPIASDVATLEAGLDMPVSKTSNFNLNYQAQISSKSTAHTTGARFAIKF